MIELAIGAAVAVFGILASFYFGRKTERNANRAKDADAYERHLEEIAAANRARNSVTDGLPDSDKYRRD